MKWDIASIFTDLNIFCSFICSIMLQNGSNSDGSLFFLPAILIYNVLK